MMGCVWAGLVFFLSLGSSTSVVINEVLYDPDGADGGYEFVELYNPGSEAIGLGRWKVETGNGSYAGKWKLEWEGGHGDSIGAGSFFVIGEERVLPVPAVVTALDLQNGPDACRLLDGEGGSDVVGWGDLVFEEYFEGEAAADAGSGSSIGRDPDGLDSGLNAVDFKVFGIPSPGDYNHPPWDLGIESIGLSRYTPPECGEMDLVCRLVNSGTQLCGRGAVLVAWAGGLVDSIPVLENLQPGSGLRVLARLPNPGPGLHDVVAWHFYDRDRWNGNDTSRTSIVVPPPPVVINEIMFRPDGRDCEWFEVCNPSDHDVNLRTWTIEDSRARAEPLATGDLIVPSGGFLVIAEDTDVFRVIHPDVDPDIYVEPRGAWPTLNDVDGPLGYADALVLRDTYGTMVDSAAYARNWAAAGRSVERIDPRGKSTNPANWSPHFGKTSSSPGSANSVSFNLPTAGRVLRLSPQAFSPNGDGKDDMVAVSVALPGPGLVRLSVFDINGRLVKRLIDGDVVDSGRVTFWDGTCDDGSRAATGVYLLLFEAGMQMSDRRFEAKLPVILVRR